MSKISFYNSFPPKGQPHISTGQMTVDEFLGHIKFGKWKELVEPIRFEKDKKQRDLLKRNLIAITASGLFHERTESKLINHSGFICIDVDNFTDKSRVVNDPYTYACFDSVSGNGFAVMVKVDSLRHKDCFRFLQKHYFTTFGIVVDPAPQNVASLRFVSFDPTVEINAKSKVSRTLVEPKKKPATLTVVLSGDKVAEYVNQVVKGGHSVASTYEDYLNLSFALVSGFGEIGRTYFHALCATDSKYDSRHADRQYDIAIKRGKTGVTVGTFYHMLKMAGVKLESDQRSVATATLGKRSGRNKEAVKQHLHELNGISQEQAGAIVDEVFSRDDLTLKSITHDPERLIESLVEWLTQNHPLRRNVITRAIEEHGSEIKTERMNTIYLRARSVFNTTDVNFDLINRIIYSDFTPEFHPITEYIEKNSWRKSTGNIDALMRTINSDTPGGQFFLYRWLLGIIGVYKGDPVPYVLALVGKGKTGKTEWFRRLMPAALKPYYGESKLDAGKDDELLMCQKIIIMDDELDGKSKQDEKRLKALTSKQIFSLRAPYARQNENFKRLALLCGTANNTDIITDRTGNRRVLVIEVESINHAAYNEIDKDELFMEIYRLYESGETWHMEEAEHDVLVGGSKAFETINSEAELLQQYFYPGNEAGVGFPTDMMATEIKNHIETVSAQRIFSMKYFGIELKKYFGPGVRRGAGMFYKVIKKTVPGN